MKYFTEEQLAIEIKPLSERAREALIDGDLDQVHALLNRMAVGHRELDTLGVQWLARMLGQVRAQEGESCLNNLLMAAGSYVMAPYAKDFLNGNEQQVVSEIIKIWRSQIAATIVPVDESDTEIVFQLAPCGSGGRLMLEGWHETEPRFFSPCQDGTPIVCRCCQALQAAFNTACGETVWTTQINPRVAGGCRMQFSKQTTRGQRLFDAGALYELTTPRCRQAVSRLQAGDTDIASLIANQQHEWRPWHDLLVQLLCCIQSYVYTEKGTKYLDDFLKQTYDSAFAMFYPAYDALDDVTLFRLFVNLWHYHIARFTVTEEDDRFVFTLDPCGSGGRLLRGQMTKEHFRYDAGLPCTMKAPADINFNREAFPIYCTHCASSNRDQFDGRPFAFIVDGHAQMDDHSPCIQYLYKKDAKREVESSLLVQVGRTSVAPLRPWHPARD